MEQKQISVTLPEVLWQASQEYSEEYGYRNLQEFIVDILRKKVIMENVERYQEIEERMKSGKGIKKFNQKEAANYLKGF